MSSKWHGRLDLSRVKWFPRQNRGLPAQDHPTEEQSLRVRKETANDGIDLIDVS
jgi:hypothetical protein